MTDTIPFWAKEQLKLRGVYNAWVTEEIERYESLGFHELFKDRKGHALDECGGYTRNFVATYCLTGDERIVAFMKQFRDDWHDTLTKGGHFYHGFPSNEHGDYITHTAEAFTQFLLNVLYLDMEDETTVRMVEDGAEHLGNWHPDVQPFYDWDRHVFQSYFLGTRSPFHRPPHNFQTPRHFRVLQIAVAAYEATHNPRYLDLCKDYCDFWADHILATPDAAEAPTACYLISPDEYREFAKDDEIRGSRQFGYYRNYNENVTAVSTKNGKPCIPYGPVKSLRPPYHILNDPVMTWLEIYKHVPEDRYREAISRYMAGWVDLGDDRPSQVAGQEPHCGVHLPKYRDFTGDKTLDERYIEQWPDGACAYLLTGDEERILGGASGAAALFTQALWRNSGCFGDKFATIHACNTISNAGTSSAYIAPALFMPVFGGLHVHYGRAPWINVLYYTNGRPGLPENVAALYVPPENGNKPGAKFVNTDNRSHTVFVRPVDPASPENLALTETQPEGLQEITLEPNRGVEIAFEDRLASVSLAQ